ncbi:hypothetical protein HYH03_014059 [Edaphochlamys debaryana]|uniref:Uncharacterized protein n=1 Tax=Edaphochlamys debaryana TaxID=47281 RepID=A0A835XQY2_9CHLO|nr:hypothetical protein HYH03_014059 [Edaphochlamys debaryana]|eukprot:KAG2487343.1 hypothetical protein HYH03_014059 [Edaphochlamys debaryana]
MSSDDDAEELAAMRAERAARSGGAATLSQLRDLQRRAEEAAERVGGYMEGGNDGGRSGAGGSRPGVGPPRPPPGAAGGAGGGGGRGEEGGDEDDEDGPVVVEEPDRMDDPLRAALPMSFGLQEKKVENPLKVHSQYVRPDGKGGGGGRGGGSFGPPRPPGAGGGGGGSFGPPRPPPKRAEGEGGPSVGPPRPPARGEGEEGEEEVGPPRPPPGSDEGADSEDEEDEEAGEEEDPYGLPISHEAVMKGATKAISCLDIEYTGTRMVTGSYDYMVRIYDFHGMKSDMKCFREVEASEGHPVLAVSWSPSGDAFLVVTGSAQAKMYDRDGRALGEFVRGDMYIRDARNTKGHISGLTGGQWHPTDKFTAITSSEDGTVRVWDTHNILQKTVIKPTLAKPGRTSVTAVSYNSTGSLIGAGLADGTIQIWGVGGKFGVSAAVGQVLPPSAQMVEKQGWSYVSRPTQLARDAHEAGTEITCLNFSSDNTTLLSRGTDGTLKIWDLRNFRAPVHAYANLPAPYAQARAVFSPDESLILTGTGAAGPTADGGTEGAVCFYSRAKNELVRKVGMPGNVTALAWHHRLNQIFVGIGNRKFGETHALYDLTRSERGVLSAASRRPRAANPLDFIPPLLIKTPHALPMYREDPVKKRKAEKEAQRARRPDLGMVASGRGKGGKLGATGGTLLTQHLLKQRGGMKAPEHEQDPREKLLKHADKAKDEFSAWTAAYRSTQPQPVYAQEEAEEEEEA